MNMPASVPVTGLLSPAGLPTWCLSISSRGWWPELPGHWQIPTRGRIWSRASSPPANERGAETSNSPAGLAARV